MKVSNQGKAIAEQQEHGGYLLMLPDGIIEGHGTKKKVERAVRKWAKTNLKSDIGLLELEWR